ncbi:MAG: glycine--tRNA ligase subunit alpha [Tissierellia bacterium]|nr:glycine--tRNA ligase subunit alpha [Tissierellia bacterium]
MNKIINQIREGYKTVPIVELPSDFVEVGRDIATPVELFYVLSHEKEVCMTHIKVRDLKKASYSEHPMETSQPSVLRLIDSTGQWLNLEILIQSLQSMFEDFDDYILTYDTEREFLQLSEATVIRTNVYMNGLKVAALRYIQSFLKEQLSVIPVVIEYHLEHIAMLSESAFSVFDLAAGDNMKLKDLYGLREREIRSYIFDDTTIENEQLLFERYVSEAQMLIRHNLRYLAYGFVIRAYNVLQLIRGKTGLHSEGYVKNMDTLNDFFRHIVYHEVEGLEDASMMEEEESIEHA